MSPRRLLLGLMLLFWAAALLVFVTGMNQALFLALRAPFLAWGSGLWSTFTVLGDALVAPLCLVPFLKRRPQLAFEGLIAAILATIETHGMKPLLAVPRPPAVLSIEVMGPSFYAGSLPSGHTITAFTLVGVLILSASLNRPWAILGGMVFAGLVGLSRIVVGVHWPIDVLVGAGLGLLAAVLTRTLIETFQWETLALESYRPLCGLIGLIAALDLFVHDSGYTEGLWVQQWIAFMTLAWLILDVWMAKRNSR